MADAIISAVAERVTAIIADQIRYEVNLVRGVEKKIIDLSDKLETLRNVLDDAEKRGAKDQSVKKWLKKLEDATYEMGDILDEWNYALLKHKLENAVVASAKQKVCCSFIPTSCLCFKKVVVRRDTAMKIQNIEATLDQILKEKDDFSFVISLPVVDAMPEPPRVQSTSLIELEKVHGVGIDRNKNDIVRKLNLNSDSQIVSIVGMGGIGKTTLAQLVYNDSRVKDCFELRIWICVSHPFDVSGVARGIVESVGKEIIPPNINQLELVLQKLRDSISGKKFLLVLDDVWTEKYDEWEPLKISLKYSAPTSKILVTTRNEGVVTMMGTLDSDIYRPEQLSDEECWSLLRCISLPGRSDGECREFEDVGKKITRKCDGLPLAANVLGSLLKFKHSLEEWQKVVESEIWQLEKEEKIEIFPHLVLSYNELSPTLKRCFSYLAIYSKDSDIEAVNVIEEWKALGYLGSVVGNRWMELKGREYFNNLAMRSLLQDFEFEETGEQIERCKMHDIVHDFAQFLSNNNADEKKKRSCPICDPCTLVSEAREYRSLYWDKKTPLVLCDCLTSLRVLRSCNMETLPQRMEKMIHLRLLDISDSKLSKEDLKIICGLYLLQTLLLEDCYLEEIPKEIGNLDGLRHLDLSMNEKLKELPESICSLRELESLSLKGCSLEEIREEIGNMVGLRHLDLSMNEKLKELPESICGLLELQILDLSNCYNLNGLPERIHMLQNLQQLLIMYTPTRLTNCMPKAVGQLTGLRTLELGAFKVGSGWNKLGLLKNLNRLTGFLMLEIQLSSISDLEELVEDAREAELRNKIHLQSLKIYFSGEMECSSSSSASLWINVIEALEPNQKLKVLAIHGYGGCRLPDWISSPLNLVKQIRLIGFTEVSSLPHMGKLPLLESLHICEMHELKVVGREFLGIESSSTQDVLAFPKLKELEFSDCKKWEEWEDITVKEEESATVSVMPCLTHLTINSCPLLKKLPHRLLHKASSLQSLDISDSSELESYRDKNGSPWRSISQYNPQLELCW